MLLNDSELERQLLETSAGQAVYDALVQANINLQTVPLETVKRMLVAECRFRLSVGSGESEPLVATCS